MDEALVSVALDVSGRPHLSNRVKTGQEEDRRVRHAARRGVLPALVNHAGLTLHIELVSGKKHAPSCRGRFQGSRAGARDGRGGGPAGRGESPRRRGRCSGEKRRAKPSASNQLNPVLCYRRNMGNAMANRDRRLRDGEPPQRSGRRSRPAGERPSVHPRPGRGRGRRRARGPGCGLVRGLCSTTSRAPA